MKLVFTIFLFLLCTICFSQSINLPNYHQGQYENDTVLTYYGSLPFNGIGNIELGNSVEFGFITGVDFKLVIDSTNQGDSPSHAAFKDSSGTLIPVYKGDTLNLPASLKLYSGDIGFRVIIEGTPTIAGESYLCNLGYIFSTGTDWNLLITENTQDSCFVDYVNGFIEQTTSQRVKIFPNPFKQNATVELENTSNKPYDCILYSLTGKEVKSINNISSNKFFIDKDGLPPGTYIFQLQNQYGIIASKKLVKQ